VKPLVSSLVHPLGPAPIFLCCRCYQLAYASQRENPNDRALRRANNIRMRLGGEPGIATLFPEAFEEISSPPIEPIGMTC
jgi:hypothetical protein